MITFPPEDYVFRVDQFQPAIFSCAAAGIPPPAITWTRLQDEGNTTLQASASITIGDPVLIEDYTFPIPKVMGTVIGVNRSLTLNEALDGDSGLYTCVANNTAGDIGRVFQLEVQG